tara:strand:- start:3853 stop:4530 length:678 start_codon:yes stop_codon:yes gene_type:complete
LETTLLEYQVQDPTSKAQYCIIWLHGLGASMDDLASLAHQPPISFLPCRHVFINAPLRPVTLNAGMTMRAWYDILGLDKDHDIDFAGLEKSRHALMHIINAQITAGFSASQILLAGFSQGGAMALNLAMHSSMDFLGVIALSAYLPFEPELKPRLPKSVPFFLGMGQLDEVVKPKWTELAHETLVNWGYEHLVLKSYPIAHTISIDEIMDVLQWLHAHTVQVATP